MNSVSTLMLLLLLGVILTNAARLPGISGKRMIDLTHPLDKNAIGYPNLTSFHLDTIFKGYTKEGFWLQMENYGGCLHVGTHLDAPCHVHKDRWTVDQIPLSHFIAPAAVIDITHRAQRNRDAEVQIEDFQNWEWLTDRSLDGTIVLVNSGWSKKWSNKTDFLGTSDGNVRKLHFPGISAEAARWIAKNRKIYGLGIDTTSLDNGPARDRPAHEALFAENVYGIENVANVDQLPAYGATVLVVPTKITGAGGAPTTVWAFLDEPERIM